MRETTLIRFLRRLDLWPLKQSGTHFKTSCLLQETRHVNGIDSHPSATISADTFPSWFQCFSCGAKMPLYRAVQLACVHKLGRGWAQVANEMMQAEEQEQPIGIVRRPKVLVDVPVDMTPTLRKLIESGGMEYPDHVVEFFAEKNVTVETARRLLWCFIPAGYVADPMTRDPSGEIIPAIFDSVLFPTLIRNPTNPKKAMCVGAQARPVPKRRIKYITLFPYNAGFYLYGEHLLPTTPGQPLFVVEGPIDMAHLLQLGFPAIALFGLHVTAPRAAKIARNHTGPIFLFLDPDQREQKSVESAMTGLKKKNPDVRLVQWKTDPKYCSENDLREITGTDPPPR